MVPIRRRHRVEIAPGKSEGPRDLFFPYAGADRTPRGRASPRSEPDLECPRHTEWFVGRGEHQSSAYEMVGDNSLQQGACVPVERG